ncbi:MAG: hypothetical protein ACRD1Y_09185, partial [Terriglobales bacterium]
CSESLGLFALLQSRPHELWARFFSSSLEDRLRYAPSDCFETFPFPASYETNAALESIGREYYDYRADLMIKRDLGLTKIYNLFHNRYEHAADIVRLRELHAALDRAVLDAYGWHDLDAVCDFLPEYETAEGDEEEAEKEQKYRYRWPDALRDEVLARLLALNQERAQQERTAAETADRDKKPARRKKATAAATLFPEG